MAHPLTQHPFSSIPFPSAPRPSPLGFGFAAPSPSAFRNAATALSSFGQNPSTPSTSQTPKRPSFTSPAHSFRTPSQNTSASLKRQRRSISPRSSSPTSGSSAGSPRPGGKKGKERDELGVESLDLKEDGEEGRKVIGRKVVKRLRKEDDGANGVASGSDDVDVGLLLATLPPSAHLPILINILQSNPALTAQVLSSIPEPDIQECQRELGRLAEKARKAAAIGGAGNIQLDAERAWSRAQKSVDEFCRTASTYLSFITSPSTARAKPDHQTLEILLNAISNNVLSLLSLIPPTSNPPASAQLLLQLGKTIVSQWTTWLDSVSTEINQKGGMLPHSIVSPWIEQLDILADSKPITPNTSAWPQSPSSWAFATPSPTSTASHPLVDSFRSAMQPIRDRFINELGWLVGRHPVTPSLGSSTFQAMFPVTTSPWASRG